MQVEQHNEGAEGKFDPLRNIDIEELAQYCWFADRDVDKMANSYIHNMIYW